MISSYGVGIRLIFNRSIMTETNSYFVNNVVCKNV